MKQRQTTHAGLEAHVDHLLRTARDPEATIRRLVRELDEAVSRLRREAVEALGLQAELERGDPDPEQLAAASARAGRVKRDLLRMGRQAALVRRKRNELLRSKRIEELQQSVEGAQSDAAEALSC